MERRSPLNYPAVITPEHDKRAPTDGGPLHADVEAAYAYVNSVLPTSDFTDPPAWHGWAIREAFLAGISYATTDDRKN